MGETDNERPKNTDDAPSPRWQTKLGNALLYDRSRAEEVEEEIVGDGEEYESVYIPEF